MIWDQISKLKHPPDYTREASQHLNAKTTPVRISTRSNQTRHQNPASTTRKLKKPSRPAAQMTSHRTPLKKATRTSSRYHDLRQALKGGQGKARFQLFYVKSLAPFTHARVSPPHTHPAGPATVTRSWPSNHTNFDLSHKHTEHLSHLSTRRTLHTSYNTMNGKEATCGS